MTPKDVDVDRLRRVHRAAWELIAAMDALSAETHIHGIGEVRRIRDKAQEQLDGLRAS